MVLARSYAGLCVAFRYSYCASFSFFSGTRRTYSYRFQFIFEGLFGLCVGGLFETPPAISLITPEVMGQMAFLIVFASVVAFGIQNVSLAYVPPAQASLFLSLESVFGVVFSVLLYGEVLTARLVIGLYLFLPAITRK